MRAAFGAATLHRGDREFARHDGFRVDSTPIYQPRKKGKVESADLATAIDDRILAHGSDLTLSGPSVHTRDLGDDTEAAVTEPARFSGSEPAHCQEPASAS